MYDRSSIPEKLYHSDKIKGQFFQAVPVLVLMSGYTTWSLTKRLKIKLDGNCTRMVHAFLNKSWKQRPTKQ